MGPEYLCELVSIRKSSRKLKSSSQILLQVPVTRLKSNGDYAFSVAVHNSWNRLLANIINASSREICLICSKNTPVKGCFHG